MDLADCPEDQYEETEEYLIEQDAMQEKVSAVVQEVSESITA